MYCHFGVSPVNYSDSDSELTVRQVLCRLLLDTFINEPRYEKTGFLHMRKQRRRSASR